MTEFLISFLLGYVIGGFTVATVAKIVMAREHREDE